MESTKFGHVYTEVEPPVARLVLNRPDKLNAVNLEFLSNFQAAMDHLEADDDITVIVVRGEGRAFSSGGDLEEAMEQFTKEGGALDPHEEIQRIEQHVETWRRLWDSPKVTIARVHGYCLAGGISIAMNCDMVVAAEDATFGVPETVGFPPSVGFWPFTIGPHKTKQLLLTGATVSGAEAAEMGMINAAVSEDALDDEVMALVESVVTADAEILYYAKRLANQTFEEMGVDSMFRYGLIYNMFAHLSQAREQFSEAAAEKGVSDAITDEFRGEHQ
jgi:enoyl-CoA hydratase